MRTTFSIKWLLDHVNEFNRTSEDQYKSEREGKNMLLETILHEAGCYCGFGYLSADRGVYNATTIGGDAMSVGIHEQKEDGSWNFDDTDHTRVYYYTHRKL